MGSTLDILPFLFLDSFQSASSRVDLDSVRSLALAVRLLSTSLLLSDEVMDLDCDPRDTARTVLRFQAMQMEAHRIFGAVFPAESSFWARYRDCMAEYSAAVLFERQLVDGEKPWTVLTEDVARDLAIGKNRPYLVPLAGLAALAGREGPYADLVRSVEAYCVALQMYDDLRDWKRDLREGFPSLLLARAVGEWPGAEKAVDAAVVQSIGRELYYGGHMSYVLELGLEALARADRAAAPYGDLPWRDGIEERRCELATLLGDFERIIAKNTRAQEVGETP